MIKHIIATTAALGLISTPVLAQAERAPAPVEDSEALEGENGILIALLAAAAVIAGLIIIASDDDEEVLPTSP